MGEFRAKWAGTADRYGISFGDNENVLKVIVIMFAQACEYTKNH